MYLSPFKIYNNLKLHKFNYAVEKDKYLFNFNLIHKNFKKINFFQFF